MIGYLKGEVKLKTPEGVILLVNDVGYDIFLPTSEKSNLVIGQERELFIYTHVREDVLSLYGFTDYQSLEFFKMLLTVSGIGPKVALAIISSSSIEKLQQSISNGDPTLLSTVSGVGKKTAEKAVVELKGKLGFVGHNGKIFEGGDTEEIYSCLSGLGFKREEITEGIRKLPETVTSVDDKIKELIKTIGRNNK